MALCFASALESFGKARVVGGGGQHETALQAGGSGREHRGERLNRTRVPLPPSEKANTSVFATGGLQEPGGGFREAASPK